MIDDVLPVDLDYYRYDMKILVFRHKGLNLERLDFRASRHSLRAKSWSFGQQQKKI